MFITPKIYLFFILTACFLVSCSSFKPITANLYERADSALISFFEEESIPITNRNEMKLLNGGEAKFTQLFEDIRNAKHHIHLEYFNFRNDSINALLIDLLAQKVKEGVEVRALFDAFGNMSNNRPLKERHLEQIRELGIDIVKFDPITFPWVNHVGARDHRKIVIIDGNIAYTGGINVADYYIDGIDGIGDWRDMHVKVNGEATHELQDIFLAMWNKETKQNINGNKYYAPIDDSIPNARVAVVDRWPGKTPKNIRRAYANAIYAAKDSVKIVNPYFVPTPIIRKAIKKALAKGVKIEIMISSKSDIPFTPEGAYHVAHKLMKKGAKVYLYDGGFHHAKVMVVDDNISTVGSTNLNSRSLFYDYESNLFFFKGKETEELSKGFDKDKEESRLLTPQIWKKRSTWKKIVGWFANVMTPFL